MQTVKKGDIREISTYSLNNELRTEVSNLVRLEELLEGEFELTPEVISTYLEGNTNTFEIVDIINQRLLEEEIVITGITAQAEYLDARLQRAKNRARQLKDCTALVFESTKLDKIERPAYTVYKRNNPSKLVIEDEKKLADTPFVTVQMVTTLDKESLKDQLRKNEKNKAASSELIKVRLDLEAAEQALKESEQERGKVLKVERLKAKVNKLEQVIQENPFLEISGAKLEGEGYSITFKRT